MSATSFRGAYVRLWFERTPAYWCRLRVAPESCEQERAFLGTTKIDRTGVAMVLCERRNLILGKRKTVTFLDRYGNRLGLAFVALRPRRVIDALVEDGWPVRVEPVGLRGRRFELVVPGGNRRDKSESTPPAGWYADSRNPAANRWWDGRAWGAVQGARVADRGPPSLGNHARGNSGQVLPAHVPARSAVAWAIASTPLIGLVFAIIAMAAHSDVPGLLSPPVSVLGVWLASLGLAVVDSRRPKVAGWSPVIALAGPCVRRHSSTSRRVSSKFPGPISGRVGPAPVVTE
ncbi:DUF2510 domain-containing protein [Frankia sp. AgB1.8]|nr:DUF2510 domain-containing protein [Frankia sp. AgB1.8]